jgi:PKD repeat protein
MLLLAGAVSLLAFAALVLMPGHAHAAEAKGYGELARFGEKAGDKAGELDETHTRAIGVDPTENSVYVLDEPKKASKETRFYRLQKFTESGGKYTSTASVEFEEKYIRVSPGEEEGEEAEPATVEGIAVDPTEHRIYLLAVNLRDKKTIKKNHGPDAEEVAGRDLPVASTLYSFSTEPSGGKLVAASGTKEPHPGEIGVLDGGAELQTQSETAGKALLSPAGITVDPAKHEVIVLAHVDDKGNAVDNVAEATDHYVLQRIKSTGALGEQYVDTTNKLKEKNEFTELRPAPHSPVVVSVEGKERVYVGYFGIAEVPYEFSSSQPPRVLTDAVNPLGEESIEGGITNSTEPAGGRLTASPEGTLFGVGGIVNSAEAGNGSSGIVAFSPGEGSEIGWTGGQVPSGLNPQDRCVLRPYPEAKGDFIGVAAGSGGKVFALVPEFLSRFEYEEEEVWNEEKEEYEIIVTKIPREAPFFGAVVEFGPGGTGCPAAKLETPTAKVAGIEVQGEGPVAPGVKVTFSSAVKQADALKVEWNFGDGSPPVVESKDEYQKTTITHQFETAGKFTVTETVSGDDLNTEQVIYSGGLLATPTLTVKRTISISKPLPKAEFVSSSSGQTAKFDASSSSDKEGTITIYKWSFGDGTSAETTGPTVEHAYGAAGTYGVVLKVRDSLGNESAPVEHFVTVGTPTPPSSPPGGGGSPPATTTSSGPSSNPGPASGVLPYSFGLPATSLTASSSGAISLKVDCLGKSNCSGTVTLRTASAVIAGHKKSVLTLASGSFSAAGGQIKVVTLHLSSKARALLQRSHLLRTLATVVVRDSQGTSHTTQKTLVLHAAKPKHH